MRANAMALAGASGSVGCSYAAAISDERLVLRPARAPEGGNFAFAAGRSLLVCSALAAGIAGGIIGIGGRVDGFKSAYAATPTTLIMPKPRLGGTTAAATQDTSERTGLLSGWWNVDRVLPDVILDLVTRRAKPPQTDPEEILQFGPMRIRRHLVETILKAAQATDADPVLLMAIADKESSFSTGVRARTSSATGLFQFIEKTWLRVVRDFGARHGLAKEAKAITWVDDELVVADAAEKARILELRREPYISALLAAEMLKRDRQRIGRRIGRDLTHGETYLAHFLGPDDAERFMEKVVEEPQAAAAKLLPKPARANKPIFFARAGRKQKSLSVAEVHRKFSAMMDLRLDRYRNVQQVADAAPGETASIR
jgi:hypothetical protein